MRFRFKPGPEHFIGDEDFYALCNGYCDALLARLPADQRAAVEEAAETIETFFREARRQGVLGES